MIRAFNERAPWAVVLVALIAAPTVGMLYVGRPSLALLYFLLSPVVAASPFLAVSYGFLDFDPMYACLMFAIALRIGASAHAFKIRTSPGYAVPAQWYARWYGAIFLGAVLPIGAALMFRIFLFEPFNSPSVSMLPTLKVGDNFAVEKFAYVQGSLPQRGDVVVFRSGKVSYVKRVIGLPGDKIQMKAGVLYINGVAAARTYLNTVTVIDQSDGSKTMYRHYRETLPGGVEYEIYEVTDDGPLDNTAEYVVPEHSYFVLGDNRDSSMDSRVDKIGFIADDAITGRALFAYWNPNLRKVYFKRIQ